MTRHEKRLNRKKAHLTDLLGVILLLIENSEDEKEREFFEEIAKKTENKIKEIVL